MEKLLVCAMMTALPLTFGLLLTPPQNTTATANNETKLICRVDNPDSFFEWKQYVTSTVGETIFANPPGGQPVNGHYKIEDTYDLVINTVQLADGGQYGCSTFDMDTPALATLVVLDAPTILSPDLIENQTTIISCSAHYGSSRPNALSDLHRPTLHIFVDGREQSITTELLPGRPPQDGSSFQASILSTNFNYTPKILDEGRELRCEIRTNTPAASISTKTVVRVLYGVRNIALHPRRDSYRVGDEINCTAEGNPEPDINWSPRTSPYPYIPTGNTLYILESMIGENIWKCMARNTVEVTDTIETKISFIVEPGLSSAVSPLRQSLGFIALVAVMASLFYFTLI